MRRSRRLGRVAAIAAAVALCGAAVATGALDTLRARAERLAAAGRCEEALADLDEMAAAAPLDARALVVAGQCQMRLQRYEQAVASFERARTLDPGLPLLDLQLGIARFHADDLSGAERAFGDARAAGSTRPELDFYEALLRVQSGQGGAQAARSLEQAGRDHPARLDPAASYYAGLAWRSAKDEERAREAFDRVIAEHPGTPWAEASQRALASLDSVSSGQPSLWVRAETGVEWNSNVAYIGQGLPTPEEIDSDSSVGFVWSGEVGSEFWRRGPWAAGARGFYYGSTWLEAHDYDLEYPGLAVWLDRATGERSLFRLEGAFGHAWLGYDPYVSSWALTPQWFHDHGRAGVTRLFAVGYRDNFLSNDDDVVDGTGVGEPCPPGSGGICGPAGLDEDDERDRDGIGITAGVDHTLTLPDEKTQLRGGIFGERYDAKGDQWSNWGVGTHLGVRRKLPWELTLDVEGLYVYRPFDAPSTYPDPDDSNLRNGLQYGLPSNDRTDNVYEVDVRIERPITDRLRATLRYDYLRNQSNTPVFDYDRHLVGGYLTFYWEKPRR